MVSAGSVKNFYSLNSTLLNGEKLEMKPWSDTGDRPLRMFNFHLLIIPQPTLLLISFHADPKAERNFYMARDKWYPTWKRPSLDVDYVKIYAVWIKGEWMSCRLSLQEKNFVNNKNSGARMSFIKKKVFVTETEKDIFNKPTKAWKFIKNRLNEEFKTVEPTKMKGFDPVRGELTVHPCT